MTQADLKEKRTGVPSINTNATYSQVAAGMGTYQREAVKTAIFPEEVKVVYPALGLGNEAGEVQGKLKKIMRDCGVHDFRELGSIQDPAVKERLEQIADELGDVLWYLAVLADNLNVSLGVIAANNLRKLASRQERGVLKGDGDKR